MKKLTSLLLITGMFCFTTANASLSLTDPVLKSGSDSAVTKDVVLDDVVATDALREFRSLSRVDKKMRIKEVKKTIKEYKEAKKAGGEVSTNTLLLVILAILLPPLAVGLHEHELNGKFWLSVLLTLLFWLPGVIYALIVVLG
ncbi:MAG: YqaE/Pmp3 family membrane protein [Bacteroidota bacterium]